MKAPIFDKSDYCVMYLENFMSRFGLIPQGLPMIMTMRFVEKYGSKR